MEQKKYKQINTKTPEIQEMILSYQIGGVAYELSQRLEISPALALDLFYRILLFPFSGPCPFRKIPTKGQTITSSIS